MTPITARAVENSTGVETEPTTAPEPAGQIKAESLNALARSVGVVTTSSPARTPRRLRVAILDNGFRGFSEALGSTIPAGTKLRRGPIAIDPKLEEEHGLKMAEIFSGLMDKTDVPYDLHLFQALGYTNLETAVETLILENFDLVLYSQVWEYGGFGEGQGFINALVSRATSRGILWMNAAGNFAKSTFISRVERGADDWALLPGPNQSIQIRCYRNETGFCPIRLVLAWNSFSNDVNQGTDKDLDLVLSDDTLTVLKTGGLVQKRSIVPGTRGVSIYPREIVETKLKPGLYFARVKIRSSNFTASDRLRLTVSGTSVELLNKTEGETLLAPADNLSVISVGASDTQRSSFSQSTARPELRSPSLIETDRNLAFKGSSNASAAYAARAATELARRGKLSREEMLNVIYGK